MVTLVNNKNTKTPIYNSEVAIPSTVTIPCSHCKVTVSMQIPWKISLNKRGNYGDTICPNCSEDLRFFYIVNSKSPKDMLTGELYLYPGTKERKSIAGMDSTSAISEPIKRSYESTIVAFNTQQWNSTAVMSRRLLEGIVQMLQPKKEKKNFNLNQALSTLPEVIDFNKPIVTIADAIRKMGNMGAHFSDEIEPDEETSILLMDLLDYFIEYIFILPSRIEELHEKIEKLNQPKVGLAQTTLE